LGEPHIGALEMHCKKKRHTSLKFFEIFRLVSFACERCEAQGMMCDAANGAFLGRISSPAYDDEDAAVCDSSAASSSNASQQVQQ
jgi:hypothetical protein